MYVKCDYQNDFRTFVIKNYAYFVELTGRRNKEIIVGQNVDLILSFS